MFKKMSDVISFDFRTIVSMDLWVSIGMLLVGQAVAIAAEESLAQQILKATEVKGGLIVHAGCGDGKLTAALRANDSYMVHGLDTEAANIEKARKHIRLLGLYGKVSVEQWDGKHLPYVDNLVNLFVAQDPDKISMDEVMRILAPNGVAYIKRGDVWTMTVKPRPKEMDEWTHYMHDPSGNAVAHDSIVGPPRHLQWVGSPRWTRHHDHMSSICALVSAGGRIFYIIDEGLAASIQLPPKWTLIARDAFNGVVLWKRPISSWHTHIWPLKSGPAQHPRRLVAVGDEVYVTLGFDGPLSKLDAATGEIIKTYEDTRSTVEVIVSDGSLFTVVEDSPKDNLDYKTKNFVCWAEVQRVAKERPWDEQKERSIVAVDADTGSRLWKKKYQALPLTLAVDTKCVFFHDGEKIVCLDRKNGDPIWNSPPLERRLPNPVSFAPTLVVYKDVILFSGGTRSMSALSAKTGKVLWTSKHPRSGHHSPEDLLIVDGLVWTAPIAGGRDSGIYTGRDPHTGEIKKEFPPDVKTYWFHHRCYRSKATDRYILPSRTGTEFVDLDAKTWTPNHWVRGGCVYGIMPCNGMVYAPPHPCICYAESKLNGFCALASESTIQRALSKASPENRLQRGPAYGGRIESSSVGRDECPTYRNDSARSGHTKTAVPEKLESKWRADLGGKLSSLVIADGKVFVASVDTHSVHALDEASGDQVWSYTTNGRIDSPPTIYQGRVLFGSADGHVYCLRAADGQLVWRFRAAPQDLRLMSYEQLESVWPVHGSVLVQDGVVYCVAGRSMFLDNGLRLLRLDAKTGQLLSETILDDSDPQTGGKLQEKVRILNMPVALPDILSCDGKNIYMRSQLFDLQGKRRQIPTPQDPTQQAVKQLGDQVHLFCPTGFLDDTWFHRTYWLWGESFSSGCNWWFRAGRYAPAGRILAYDDTTIYGYGRQPELFCWTPVLEYHLFAADKELVGEKIDQVHKRYKEMGAKNKAAIFNRSLTANSRLDDISAVNFKWTKDDPPLQARAMVLADKTLFIAGPPDVVDEEEALKRRGEINITQKLAEQEAAFEGQKGALLWAVDTSSGNKLAEYNLQSPPTWDGMAAANNNLFISTTGGKVVCFAGK
ncbi:MAG: PQQ-binding-like beta-propeller repeat protein [Planctomycetota bacterium]|nr:MAG: PQQ-binding-like beta-propeller repeat protein [Planctomycetota bacterium]